MTLRRALPGLAPALLVLAWLQQGLLSGEVFFKRDTMLVFLPLKRLLSQAFAQRELPEWWPYDALGQPLASLPIASLFHPTTLLYVALPEALAFTLQTLVPLVVLPLGAWRLARTLGLRAGGAQLAATVVAISFWNVLLAEQTQMHLAAMSLPWVWGEAIRLARSRRGSPLTLALATTNLVIGGDPMLLELAFVCLVPLLLRWPLRVRPLVRVAIPLFLGVALGAVQWVPMLGAWADSPRSAGLGLTVDDYWALRLPLLAGTVLPLHHGTDFLFDTIYIGVPVLALAALGAATRWRMKSRLLVVLGVLVVTAFGRAGGLWHVWSAVLPGWSGFQYPVKVLGPALVPLAMLAGRGFQSSRRHWAWPVSALGGVVLLALGVWSAALLLVLALVGFLLWRRPEHAKWLQAAACVVLAADVAWHLSVPTRPRDVVTEVPALAQTLRSAGVGLEGGFYEWTYSVPESMDTRLPNWRELQTEFQLLTVAPSTGALWELPTARPYLAGVSRRVFELYRSADWKLLAPRFGVVARLETFQGATPPSGNLAADLELGAAVVPLPGASPRAYLAFNADVVPEAQQLATLPGAKYAGNAVVLVSRDVAVSSSGRAPSAVAVKRGVDTFMMQVDAPENALLVVNEAWSRGWRATVDGVQVDTVPANYAVIGVPLAAGHHVVELEYETPNLRLGLLLSALGFVALMLWRRFNRRAPGAAAPTPAA